MRAWVEEFMEEIQKIEIFYNTKYLEYCNEFEMLKEAFLRKRYGKMTKRVKILSSPFESNQGLGHAGIMVTHHFEHLPLREENMKEIQMTELDQTPTDNKQGAATEEHKERT